jgi:hypothetical protein
MFRGWMQPLTLQPVPFGFFEGGGDAGKSLAEIGRAECGDFECPAITAHVEGLEPHAAQGMLQQRHQRGGGKVFHRGIDDEVEKRARYSLGERPAGTIVNPDAPSFETDRDPAGEQTIRRDQRCRASGRIDGLAQDERNGLGFVM